jgi:hypothetical protein
MADELARLARDAGVDLRETPTTNYGWTKPDVGGSDDVWGGEWNANLDSIDANMHRIDTRAAGTGINPNKIANGDFRIDTRHNGAAFQNTGFGFDRWYASFSASNLYRMQQINANMDPGVDLAGAGTYFSGTVINTYTANPGDIFVVRHPIEAGDLNDLAWGTPNAKPVTISFWAICSVACQVGGCIRNYPAPATRSCAFGVNIPANIWTKCVITLPGDTVGPWLTYGASAGCALMFDLGSGSSFLGPSGVWQSATLGGCIGDLPFNQNMGLTFGFTNFKMETGSTATDFILTQYEAVRACQRTQLIRSNHLIGGACVSGQPIYIPYTFPTPMRDVPGVSYNVGGLVGASGPTAVSVAIDGFTAQLTATAASFSGTANFTANCDIT